ncbi:putative 1,3-beta-glucan synthase [Rosa chinensis]|uniref:Putative 1,3-beta-glucan synthase n=1 Tax=Rosa chinensis TaxID=74649 RepID=A0A2P6QEQ1_ROSCH|nr:putative 1,3-beta-glucan synthase [Rosa chinensis]
MGISLSGEEGNTCSPLLCLPPGILDIAHRNKDYWFMDFLGLLWYLSFLIFKRRRFYTYFQLEFRILKLLLFLGYMSIMSVLFVFCDLTISDLFAAMLAFFPTGWAPLQIGQVCSVMFRSQGFSESINEFGRAYDYITGVIIFMPIAICHGSYLYQNAKHACSLTKHQVEAYKGSMVLAGR